MAKKKTKITIKPKVKGVTTGKTTFKGGVHKTRKDREKDRKDKYGRRLKEDQLEEDNKGQ